jgi:hypothetical protein
VRKAKTISARPTTIANSPMNGGKEGRLEPTRGTRIKPQLLPALRIFGDHDSRVHAVLHASHKEAVRGNRVKGFSA